MDDKELLNSFIEQELGKWATGVLAELEAQLERKQLVVSGDTLNSLRADVLKNAAEVAHNLRLMFQDSGRIKDMSSVQYKKQPPIEQLERYIDGVGLDKFKYVPGYKSGFPLAKDKAVARIAWGISKSILAKNSIKPKKWFAKPFYHEVNILINRLLVGLAEKSLQSTLHNLQNLNK